MRRTTHRIRAALPTIELLRERGASIVLASHLGRPGGKPDPELSMAPVGARLAELLGAEVEQAPAVVGAEVEELAAGLGPGEMLLLENLRFEPGETENDPELARRLAALAGIYVNDAFGAAHRAHASTEGVAHLLPGYAGLLLEREVTELTAVVESPARPLVVVLGGAKVSDKVGVIDRFLEIADRILIGGAMCFSFFRAEGIATGDSLVEEEGVKLAAEALSAPRGRTAIWSSPSTSSSARASTPRPSAARATGSRSPTAGWASTSAPAPPPPTRRRSPRRERSSGTARWAPSSSSPSPPRPAPSPRRSPRRRG